MFQKKLSSKPTRLLTEAQNMLLFSILNKNSIALTTTVARLYTKHEHEWVKLPTVAGPGVVCFERDATTRSYFLRFYNLSNNTLAFEQLIPSKGIWISRGSKTFFRLTANNRRTIVGLEFNDTPAALEEMEELVQALEGKHNKLKKAAAARADEETNLDERDFYVASFFYKKAKYTPNARVESSSSRSSSAESAVLKSKFLSPSKLRDTAKKPFDSRPLNAKEADKPSLIVNTSNDKLANDPTLACLFNHMGCDYVKIMNHEVTQKKVESLVAKYGGLDAFKEVIKRIDATTSTAPLQAEELKVNPVALVPESHVFGLISIPPPPKKHMHWEVYSDMPIDQSPKDNAQQPSSLKLAVDKEESHHLPEESAENLFLAELEEIIVDIERTAVVSTVEADKGSGGLTESSEWSDGWDDDASSLTQFFGDSDEA